MLEFVFCVSSKFTCWLPHLLIVSPVVLSVDCLTCWLSHLSIVFPVDWLPHLLIVLPVDCLTCWFRLTSPVLLIAMAACLGACYIINIKNADKKIVIMGLAFIFAFCLITSFLMHFLSSYHVFRVSSFHFVIKHFHSIRLKYLLI